MNVFADWPQEKVAELWAKASKFQFMGRSIDEFDRADLILFCALIAEDAINEKIAVRHRVEMVHQMEAAMRARLAPVGNVERYVRVQ